MDGEVRKGKGKARRSGLALSNPTAQMFEQFAQDTGLDQYHVKNTDTETPADNAYASSYRPP